MELAQLLSRVDHTLLTQTATWPEIRQLCDDGLQLRLRQRLHPPQLRQTGRRLPGGAAPGLHRHRLPQRLQHHSGQVL